MSLSQPPITPEQIAALPPEFRDLLQAVIGHFEERIAKLEAELAATKAELAAAKKTPRNSSLPPSTEHPHAKPATKKEKSGKKRGGQPGHTKHERPLIPVEQCGEVVPLIPQACRRCGESLTGTDAEPLRRQVWEIPEIKPLVTEYQLHRLVCPCCSTSTCADLPAGVPQSQAGPRLVALTALLMGCFKQSKRRVALFLEQVLNQPCSPGWVVTLHNQATAPSHRHIRNWPESCRPNPFWESTNRRRKKPSSSPGCGPLSPARSQSLRCVPRAPPRFCSNC
jgi:hypothetical protein